MNIEVESSELTFAHLVPSSSHQQRAKEKLLVHREGSERMWRVEVEPLTVLFVMYCTVVANQSIDIYLFIYRSLS